MKRCSHCKQERPLADFGKHRSRPDGLAAWCRPCSRDRQREQRADPAVRAERARKERERRARPELKAMYRLRWAEERARRTEYFKAYARTDEYRAHYRARITSPEGRERNRLVQAKRRALKAAAPATLTPEQWRTRLDEFGHCCAYCLAPSDDLEIEHMQPLALGGAHVIENVVPACSDCNKTKNRRDLLQFLAYSTGA